MNDMTHATPKPFKLLVFDWDGTLMDSQARIVTSFQTAISEMAFAVRTPEQIRNIIGLGLDKAIYTLFPEVDEANRMALKTRYRHHFLYVNSLPTPLFPSVATSLHTLQAQHYWLAVATGKSRAGLDRALTESGLNHLFYSTRCAEETRSKPDPLMLVEIMAELGVTAADTLMIGDSEYDLQMAHNAGVAAVAVSYGTQAASHLLNFNPLACFDDLAQLPTWLEARTSTSS